ncbi:hypothetical protein IP69_13710 [Bosea sp. AAP35]|uniref:HdeD family acid-resistance protein n=1 Tax=Bosea sp. AAP35 TaxID=1523417 RepID=UPI0006B9043B|nr:HdeD family acid-resistance protein [Bosea sp. AAP35]KPF67389.1 hypothetical protein IP69_13710 [Bosea sp. AAP35]
MNSSNPTPGDVQHTLNETMRTYWGMFMVQGVTTMILGVLAILWPQISTVAADIYIGWLFLFSGMVGFVMMFWAPSIPGFPGSLLTAALSLIVGILLVWHPVEGVISLTLALIAFFIVEGIFQIAAAIRYRDACPESWGWMVMSGIADLALAGAIISGWPGTASWALGLIVGVNLLTSGLAITMAALAGRGFAKTLASAAR